MRLAQKMGAKARAMAAARRPANGSESTACAGTSQATARVTKSRICSSVWLTRRSLRRSSTAARTATRTPKNTRALTSHVVPKYSAKPMTFFVSSNMNAAPSKNMSV
jgi:hypothetical protein